MAKRRLPFFPPPPRASRKAASGSHRAKPRGPSSRKTARLQPRGKPRAARRNPDFRSLYAEALRADDAFQRELVRVYGKRRASDARYSGRHTDKALLSARAVKHAADDRLRAFLSTPPRRNPAEPVRGRSRKSLAAQRLALRRERGMRHHVRSQGRVYSTWRYRVEVKRGGRWVALASFPEKRVAVEYGRALKHRYPSKDFRVCW